MMMMLLTAVVNTADDEQRSTNGIFAPSSVHREKYQVARSFIISTEKKTDGERPKTSDVLNLNFTLFV